MCSCYLVQYLKVLVDIHVVNTSGLGVVIIKACEELGVSCETKELPIPYTVMWTRRISETSVLESGKVETFIEQRGSVVQWVARLTRDWWIPVSREFESHQRPALFP